MKWEKPQWEKDHSVTKILKKDVKLFNVYVKFHFENVQLEAIFHVWNMKLEVCWALIEGAESSWIWVQLFLQRKDTGNNNVTNYGKKTVTFR